ncbi:MAG: glycosyltransferase, partial [Patescibacteria group bacterium]
MKKRRKSTKKKNKKKNLRVAIVHDFLLYSGGAERVLKDICELYPNAPIYTLLYNEEKMQKDFGNKEIVTSFLQKWPKFLRKRHKFLLPFFGSAVESFDFREFDLIISSSGAWSKGIVTRLNTKHIAYIHSPMRYVWDENEYYFRKNVGKKNNFCIRALLSYLRIWDYQAAQRPDALVVNSLYTQRRIEKYYRRDADVVYPGVSINEYYAKKIIQREHFLIISRLSEYKNVALAIETCNKLQLPLVVVGEGREYNKLKGLAGPTIEMVGWVSDREKIEYLKKTRAFLFPSEDDFGIVSVEAMRMGVPVIALGKGGASEIITPNVSGELFEEPTVEMMADAVRRFLEK